MRDINRIDKICAELAEQWKRVPDWRLTQLFGNCQRYAGSDLFFYEEDDFIDTIKDMLDELGR